MPRIHGTTDRQSSFLRAFRLHGQPPPEAWPSPVIFRRWLRDDHFRRAYADVQSALKSALAFQSLTAGLAAAQTLHDALRPHDPAGSCAAPPPDSNLNPEPRTLNPSQRLDLEREKLRHRTSLTVLRLAHARLRKPPRPRHAALALPHSP